MEVPGYKRKRRGRWASAPRSLGQVWRGKEQLQDEVFHRHLAVCSGPSSTNLLSPPQGERSHRTWLGPSRPSALCLHAPQALAGVLEAAWELPAPASGVPSLVGRMTQEWVLDPGTEHSCTGENPGCGVATGQLENRTARAEGGDRQEPDPEAPGRGLGTALSGERPWDTFDQE